MYRSRSVIPCSRIGKPYHHRGAHTMAPFFARGGPCQNRTNDAWDISTPSFPFGGFGPRDAGIGFGSRDFGLGNFMRDVDDVARMFTSDNFPFNSRALQRQQQSRVWNPNFDVKEDEGTYELRGEIPGVEGKDLDVRFVDPKTLVIRGSTASETNTASNGEAAAAQDASAVEGKGKGIVTDKEVEDDARSTHSNDSSSSYVKPSVEETVDESETGKDGDATSATATVAAESNVNANNKSNPQTAQDEQNSEQQSHYWISERSTGSFQRTFRFPGKVDQDGVTAGLKNGVLSVRVPKAKEPVREERRINVE